jgi:HPt (histidine-containing phosphotransfer) domain-containing protein
MWPGRYRRMVSALDADDQEALMDAVLSVKTSAGMLGALRLQQLALTIEDAVRKQEMDGVRAVLDELESCGQLTSDQLRDELSHEL